MQKVIRTLLSVALAIGVVSGTRSNAQDGRPSPGAVFVMTNAADRNEVISFRRAADGSIYNRVHAPIGQIKFVREQFYLAAAAQTPCRSFLLNRYELNDRRNTLTIAD